MTAQFQPDWIDLDSPVRVPLVPAAFSGLSGSQVSVTALGLYGSIGAKISNVLFSFHNKLNHHSIMGKLNNPLHSLRQCPGEGNKGTSTGRGRVSILGGFSDPIGEVGSV